MKAILVDARQALHWADVADPVIREDEVLLEVHAAALNRADLMQRAGEYPPPPGWPEWMGLEVAGKIVAVGSGVPASRWQVGQWACALLGGGGYAEYAAVPWELLMPVPEGCSLVEAAAMPEAFATAYLNLFMEGNIRPGDTLLMHAGASGLASVVIPMAKAHGVRVITTVLSAEKAESIAPLRADVVVDTGRQDIAEILRQEAEQGHPVDVAIDCLGGDRMGACLAHMRRGGRWIMIATLAGDLTQVNLKTVYTRGIRIIGSTLRSRPPEVKAEILESLVREIWPKVSKGLIRPTIDRTFPITRAQEAQDVLLRGENVGKVVLTVRP